MEAHTYAKCIRKYTQVSDMSEERTVKMQTRNKHITFDIIATTLNHKSNGALKELGQSNTKNK